MNFLIFKYSSNTILTSNSIPWPRFRLILKVLNSAVANAVNNNGANESELRISECYINPGPVYKRIKFASRGNVDRHDKRSSHITVKVTDEAKGVK